MELTAVDGRLPVIDPFVSEAAALDLLRLHRSSHQQDRLLKFQIRLRHPFSVDLERFAQPFPVLERCMRLGGADDTADTHEQRRLATGPRRAEEDLERTWRWSAKPFIRVEHPATTQRHELVRRQAGPLARGLRASPMREKTQAELNAAEVTTNLIVRDVHIHSTSNARRQSFC
ncbi:MAG: hypothetical protein ACREXP_24150 [Steroidobacteraceae bacterium]